MKRIFSDRYEFYRVYAEFIADYLEIIPRSIQCRIKKLRGFKFIIFYPSFFAA
jgi:hypothetical protein